MKYFDKRKHKMFPEIKDWADPQNHIRFNENIRDMSYKHFFFFSPYNFRIVTYGFPSITGLLLFVMTYIAFKAGQSFIALISGALLVYFIYRLMQKIKQYPMIKEMNFYDLWMREEK